MKLRRTRIVHRGFSLLELLVVVAVIALLLGLLLPALTRARVSARLIECGSNIRQLLLASDLYAHDHDDRAMPASSEIQTRNLRRWHGSRDRAGQPFRNAHAPITPYLEGPESQGVRSCPEFAATLENLARRGKGFERGCGGYGYNAAFLGSDRAESAPGIWDILTDRLGALRSRFRSPSTTLAFADAALAADEVIEYSFVEPPRWPQFPDFRPDPSTHFRHASQASIAWLDGHVTPEPLAHSESSGLYPLNPASASIGWFGDTDTNFLYDYH